MSEQNNIELPSLLSFERKLEPSDALMFSGNWDDIGKKNEEIEKKDEKVKKKVYWSPVSPPPHRQLRNFRMACSILSFSPPPHRQLRNLHGSQAYLLFRPPPHRQLRKYPAYRLQI